MRSKLFTDETVSLLLRFVDETDELEAGRGRLAVTTGEEPDRSRVAGDGNGRPPAEDDDPPGVEGRGGLELVDGLEMVVGEPIPSYEEPGRMPAVASGGRRLDDAEEVEDEWGGGSGREEDAGVTDEEVEEKEEVEGAVGRG